MPLTVIAQTMRMPFLVLTPACVFLGASLATVHQGTVNMAVLATVLLGAMLAHISVNTLNEYLDFKNGLDLITAKTPFSGGSGALVRNPQVASSVLMVGLLSLLAAALIGLYFAWRHGVEIIPIGLAGVALILTYTPWLNRQPLLCLIAPGLGFGVLMVAGTQFVLTGEYLPFTWLLTLPPFLLVNNLLLLNQYPDITADASVGRRHIVIAYGTQAGNGIHGLFTSLAGLLILLYIQFGILPPLSLIALLPLALAFYALMGARRHGQALGDYPHYLAANAAAAILLPLFLGISILLG